MSKPHPERPSGTEPAAGTPPLSAEVRRHLAQNLRALFADTLSAPASQRIEALVAELAKPKR
ncbi:hypothetical protein ACRAWG_24220 [Methylobacterium sp. P31]